MQRCYRMEGKNPTELATWVHRAKARMRRDAEDRKRLACHLVPATDSPREMSPSGTGDRPTKPWNCLRSWKRRREMTREMAAGNCAGGN